MKLLSRILVGVTVCGFTIGQNTTACAETLVNQLSEAEKRAGWELLFDGETAEGWRNYRSEKISDGWTVKDGILQWVKKRAGDIITVEQFDNFELSLEYRISSGGNSGIMFHVTEEADRPWKTGPEVQIQDNVDGHDPQKSGWLYQLYKPAKPKWAKSFEEAVGRSAPEVIDATRPAGQWNHIYLRVAKQGEVAVNGASYFYFRKGTDEWNELVAASKFAKFPRFGKATKGHICLQDHGNPVAFRNIKVRKLAADGSAPNPVDGRLPVKGVPAFPQLKWADWTPVDDRGKTRILRPIVLTHSGDGTNRIFVATQRGVIHVFKDDPLVKESKVFLDLSGQVQDWSRDSVGNETGFLGLAFHPEYKVNGEFFISYSSHGKPHESIVSRLRVSNESPDKADPASEEVLMRIPQPFANHNGGAIAFGPDRHLYIGLGDGGYRNDLLQRAQDLQTLMGSILRIDVNRKEDGRNYAIPADNPFRDRPQARPEIYAYGFRNVWRLSFDRMTGALWAGDVGQDLWEEINVVERGGNYGWSIREGTHLFGNSAVEPHDPPLDPVWEYDHRIGKSITGGIVYRGSRVPQLAGCYLYADFVSGKMWGLKYDYETGKVVQNLSIPSNGHLVLSYGEDEKGEVYYLTESLSDQGIYRFEAE